MHTQATSGVRPMNPAGPVAGGGRRPHSTTAASSARFTTSRLFRFPPPLRHEAICRGPGAPGQLVQRVFLVGANPFALQTERLNAIAGRIRAFPECRTIGRFCAGDRCG